MPSNRIQFLIDNLQEGLDVEVKNWLGGLTSNDEKARLAKEIIALANNGGGSIFIGFDDEGENHPEIDPDDGEREAFTQDTISSIVQRYVSPPCQCKISFHAREGSEISHPVIMVPGDHRTPVWAKAGSPDGTTLRTGTVYIRRPGGSSEPSRTQDDWEKLLDRLVKARQADQLDAIREILNPSEEIVTPVPRLETWQNESLDLWRAKIEPLQEGDARKLESGFWTFSFSIEPFEQPTLAELNQSLEREMPRISGWPPFTYIHREPLRPHPRGNFIEAWLTEPHDADAFVEQSNHCDFWRVSRDGLGFLLRPMQEDRPDYLANVTPRPARPNFDWVIPIYRTIELFKFVERLAQLHADENSQYTVQLNYFGMEGRTLQQHGLRYMLFDGARCAEDHIQSQQSGTISEIQFSLEEKVQALLAPIYEQFEFTELRKVLVDNVTREALGSR